MINSILVDKKQVKYYILAYFMFAFSATSFFSFDRYKQLFFAFIILLIAHMRKKISLSEDKNIVIIILYVCGVFILQSIYFESIDVFRFAGRIVIAFLLPYYLAKLYGSRIFEYYVKVIIFFAIVSLFFWALTNISNNFHQFIRTIPFQYNTDLIPGINEQFIIFSYEPNSTAKMFNESLIRNPGPTWEPGGWASFLVLALFLNIVYQKKIRSLKNFILIITIISTFSTAGLISLMILLAYFSIINKKINILLRIIIIIFTVSIICRTFTVNGMFLNKIEQQYNVAMNKRLNEHTTGRFFGYRKSIYSMSKHPIWGRGINSDTAAGYGDSEGSAHGILTLGARFGVFALLFYLVFFYKTIKLFVTQYAVPFPLFSIVIYLVLLIQITSQTIHMSILFMTFFMMKIIPNKKRMK